MKNIMHKIGKISSFLTKYIGVIIIAFSVLAFFWRDGFAWTTKYTSVFLGVAMLGMGLTIRMEDFKVVFSRPKEVLIGFVSQYTIMPLISVVSIVMIISGIVAINAEKIVSCGVLVLIVVAIHNLCGMGLGLLAAKIFHIEYSKATAIAIEVGMQNSGLAVSLATANFATSPLATLPGAIFSVWHNISGSVFAGIRRKGLTPGHQAGQIQDVHRDDVHGCWK